MIDTDIDIADIINHWCS